MYSPPPFEKFTHQNPSKKCTVIISDPYYPFMDGGIPYLSGVYSTWGSPSARILSIIWSIWQVVWYYGPNVSKIYTLIYMCIYMVCIETDEWSLILVLWIDSEWKILHSSLQMNPWKNVSQIRIKRLTHQSLLWAPWSGRVLEGSAGVGPVQ